jgi:hypothetical protein
MPIPDPRSSPVPLAVWLCGQDGDDPDTVRAAVCGHAVDRFTAPGARVLLLSGSPELARAVTVEARLLARPVTATARSGAALALHLPRRSPTLRGLHRTAGRALVALVPGGLFVTTAQPPATTLGDVVRSVEATGLAFVQHVVALRARIAGGSLGPVRRGREHLDVLVFRRAEASR